MRGAPFSFSFVKERCCENERTVRCQTKVHTQRRIFRARGENQKDKRNNKAKFNQQKNF